MSPAAAQAPICGPRGVVLQQLEQQFGEVPAGRGLTSEGAVLELLVSPAGTWTLLMSLPNGLSCLAAAGELWESVARPEDREARSPEPDGRVAVFDRLRR